MNTLRRLTLHIGFVLVAVLLFSGRAYAHKYMVCVRGQASIWETTYWADGTPDGVRLRSYAGGCIGEWWIELARVKGRPTKDDRPGVPSADEVIKILNNISEKEWLHPSNHEPASDITNEMRRIKGQSVPIVFIDTSKLKPYLAKSLNAKK